MTMSYCFEWSVDSPDQHFTSIFGGRVYKNDQRAIAAALVMFRHRTSDPNDELHVYEGRKNGWGCVEGWDGGDPRYIGKVAYNELGTAWKFYKR